MKKRIERVRRRAVAVGMGSLFIGGVIGGVIGGMIGAARASSKTDELKEEIARIEAKMGRSESEPPDNALASPINR